MVLLPEYPGQTPATNPALKSYRSNLPDFERMSEASCYYGLGQITSRIATAIFDTNRNVSCYTVNLRGKQLLVTRGTMSRVALVCQAGRHLQTSLQARSLRLLASTSSTQLRGHQPPCPMVQSVR